MEPTQEELLQAFRRFDANGSGCLCRDELAQALAPSLESGELAEADIDAILADFDHNGDGVLQVEEMAAAWSARSLALPLYPLEPSLTWRKYGGAALEPLFESTLVIDRTAHGALPHTVHLPLGALLI